MAKLEVDPVGEVEALSLEGNVLTVRSARPLPPGTRVMVRDAACAEPLADGKVASVDAGVGPGHAFDLRLRLFAPPRRSRARIEELLRASARAYQKKDPPT
jgi:hypothetical protein